MRARLLSFLVLFACGPSVEVTSATISDSNSGSAEGDSAEGAACDGLTQPMLAFMDAVDRVEASTEDLVAHATSIRGALAVEFGVAQDADAQMVAAAIEAFEQAAFEGGATLVAGDVRCTGSIPAARDNFAICEPELLTPVSFECMGNCLVNAASDCPGNAWCRGHADNCEGRCTGICEVIGAACEGTCVGECDGECDCTDDQGTCNGGCDASCTGDCEVIASSCAGTCLGECEAVKPTCTSSLVCTEPGPYCMFDCERWAVPASGSQLCRDVAALAGAADLRCEIPRARLVHARSATVTCGDIEATLAVLEERAPALDALRVRIEAIQSTAVFGALVDEFIDPDNIPTCAAMAFLDSFERLGDAGNSLTSVASDVETLRNAIAEE